MKKIKRVLVALVICSFAIMATFPVALAYSGQVMYRSLYTIEAGNGRREFNGKSQGITWILANEVDWFVNISPETGPAVLTCDLRRVIPMWPDETEKSLTVTGGGGTAAYASTGVFSPASTTASYYPVISTPNSPRVQGYTSIYN